MDAHHDLASGSLAPGADPLSDVLESVKLTGALFFLVDAGTPWAAEAPASPALAPAVLPQAQHVVSYHLVREGACWYEAPGQQPVRLDAGDVILVPHGNEYALASQPGLRTGYTPTQTLDWFRDMALGRMPFVVREGGAGPERIRVVCGFLGCDALPFNPVLSALPTLLRVNVPPPGGVDQLGALIDMAAAESTTMAAGGRSVLLRLSELVFVELVRRYLTKLPADESGWLSGLRDPVAGRALACLHASPARAWTVEELAREAATSRSVLTERFTHFVGQPPMLYLTRWRLHLAAARLADRSSKVSAVARDVGYESEAAFSRAFKKFTGVSPALWRSRRASGKS